MATLNEKVTVTFYRIVQCGYFGHADASPQFGNFPALLAEVGHWAPSKQLADTRLDAPAGEGESLPVYLSNFQQHAGDYMATVWNEVPANKDGSVTAEEDTLLLRYRAADEVGRAMLLGVDKPKTGKGK